MLKEFTEDERLKEEYRLHQAWLRDQRSSEYAVKELKNALLKEKLMREAEVKEKKRIKAEKERVEAEKEKVEAEKKKVEAEKERVEAEKKKFEEELEKKEKHSVLALRKAGQSDKSIAEILGIPEDKVKAVKIGS